MSERDWLDAWDGIMTGSSVAAVEEFWLARLEDGVGDGAVLLEALRRLRKAGRKTLAGTLLELAADGAKGEGAVATHLVILKELLRLGVGDGGRWRAEARDCLRELWRDRPSLDAVLDFVNLAGARAPVEAVELAEAWLIHDVGQVFAMAGRGPGRVVEINPQVGVLRLDFEREKRVPVPVGAASRYLTPLPEGHFLRRRLEDREGLAALVAGDPAAALGGLLASTGDAMTVSEIKAALEGLVAESQWTSWWNRARKHPDLLAEGSGARVRYRLAEAGGVEGEVRNEFSSAPLARRVELARRHGGRSKELAGWMRDALLADALVAGEDRAGAAWEAVAVAERLGAAEEESARARSALLAAHGGATLLATLGDAALREGLVAELRAGGGDRAMAALEQWLEQETHPRVLGAVVTALVGAGREARISAFLDRVFLQPERYPAAFVWALECRDPAVQPLLVHRRTGALLVRLVEVAERSEMAALRPRLRDILSARGLAGVLVQEQLSLDQARRLAQILERHGELGEQRRWLRDATMLRFPELRPGSQVEALPMLAGTVHRLQDELRALREKEIPEVLRAIQVAREHGDLRENFEYHSARARQEYLSARAAALQVDLSRAQVIDPARVETSQVRVGTRVYLSAGGDRKEIAVLGPYEVDPDRGILSHQSEVAQVVLGRTLGEEVTLEGRRWTVAGIAPFSPSDDPR